MADIEAASASLVAQANPKAGFLAGLVREHLPSLGELEPSRFAVRIPSPGGFVAKYMGDGVLVYFGYPQAHEDDAERAVRAGLKLVRTIDNVRPHTATPLGRGGPIASTSFAVPAPS
jgi:class 3 adenylate cyclase